MNEKNLIEQVEEELKPDKIPEDGDVKASDEVTFEDTVADERFNIALLEGMGLNSDVWRWAPVGIKEWITGERYLNLSKVIRASVMEDIVNFFKTKDDNPWDRFYDEAAFCEGIGSGKSFKTSIIATYFQHLLLCLRCPQEYFGVDKSSKIAIMNMSISEKNAKKVIFSEIMSKINSCQWFQERPWDRPDARVPDPNCLSELRFKNNTFIIPGSSSWRTAVGYNIVVGIMDEAGSYRTTDNSDQAEDIYHALQRRLGSRFEEKGALILAGSPLYENDFLEKKLHEGDEPDSRVYSRRRTLWDAKYSDWSGEFFYVDRVERKILDGPPADMTEIVKIPRVPFLWKAFRANVTKAFRDFGAHPSGTIQAFLENPRIMLESHNQLRKEEPVDSMGRFKDWFRPIDRDAFHSIHIDLAISGDACGFAMGHNAGYTEEGSAIVFIDLMLRMQGSKEAPVQIAKVREYIYALTQRGFKINLITFDGFQSTDSMQLLQKKGYNAEYLSVDRTMLPYNNWKAAVNEKRIDYYYVKNVNDPDNPTASEVYVQEAMRLEEIEGKKVDHPPKGSKDVCDAVCGVVHNIIENQEYSGQLRAMVV